MILKKKIKNDRSRNLNGLEIQTPMPTDHDGHSMLRICCRSNSQRCFQAYFETQEEAIGFSGELAELLERYGWEQDRYLVHWVV